MFARRLASRMTSRAMPQRRAMSGHPPPEYEGLEKALRAVFPENWQVRTPSRSTHARAPHHPFSRPQTSPTHPPLRRASGLPPSVPPAARVPAAAPHLLLHSPKFAVPSPPTTERSLCRVVPLPHARPPAAAAHRPTFTYCHHPHSSDSPPHASSPRASPSPFPPTPPPDRDRVLRCMLRSLHRGEGGTLRRARRCRRACRGGCSREHWR